MQTSTMRFTTCNIVLAVIVGIAIVSGDASEVRNEYISPNEAELDSCQEHIIADYVVPEASPSRTQVHLPPFFHPTQPTVDNPDEYHDLQGYAEFRPGAGGGPGEDAGGPSQHHFTH